MLRAWRSGVRLDGWGEHFRPDLWRRALEEEGVDIGKSNSQVMPVMVNNDAKVFAVAEKIQQRGLYLQPVTYPAVPKHRSRLRVSISAAHSEEQLERAVHRPERIVPQALAVFPQSTGQHPSLPQFAGRP